jgi:hypothetical protein
MALLRFRVYWEEDDQVYRDIELLTGQTFLQFHETIIKAYEFDGKHTAVFYESNDRWERNRGFASDVMSNKKDAPLLSMVKTPVSALVNTPDQKFVYVYDPQKEWTFLVELVGVAKDANPKKEYPLVLRKEGLPPAQYAIKPIGGVESMLETEEQYDLSDDDMAEGYGNEGEEEFGSDESYGDE